MNNKVIKNTNNFEIFKICILIFSKYIFFSFVKYKIYIINQSMWQKNNVGKFVLLFFAL